MNKTIATIFGFALAMQAQDAQTAAQLDAQKAAVQKLRLALDQQGTAGTASPEMQRKLADAQKKLKDELDTMELKTFTFVSGQMYNGNPVKGAPYSAEAVTETTQTLADGSHIKTNSSTVQYRDGDGRERHEETIGKLGDWNAQGEAPKVVFISDPVAKLSYTLHPNEKTAEKNAAGGAILKSMVVNSGSYAFTTSNNASTTSEVRAGRGAGDGAGVGISISTDDNPQMLRLEKRAAAGGANAKNTKTEDLGTQIFEGVSADGTRTTTTIPAGQIGNERDINIVNERWYSKELQMVVKTVHSDPRTGETVYQLKNINRTEPQPSLFEVPADYKVNDGAINIRKMVKDE